MPGIAPTVGTGSRSLLSAGCGHVALDVPLRNGFACGPPLTAWAIPCCLDAGKPSRSSVSPVCWCCEFSSEQLEMVFACCAEVFWSGSVPRCLGRLLRAAAVAALEDPKVPCAVDGRELLPVLGVAVWLLPQRAWHCSGAS